jgi:glycolate oxidase iron-sulfur subunit
VSEIAMDVSECDEARPARRRAQGAAIVAYHAACSLQHGQQIKTYPKDAAETGRLQGEWSRDSHLCCGSAGTYNLMQPEISGQLKARKVETLEDEARRHRGGQYRLHDADRIGDRDPHGAYR